MPDGPLRIAQLIMSASRHYAGLSAAACGLSVELTQCADLELEVFAVEDEHTVADRHQWDGIPVHAFPMVPPKAFSYAPGLSRAVRSFRPDVVHQHGIWTYTSFVARTLANEGACRVVISPHGALSPWALQYKAGRKKIALWLYERENLAKADCLHATSDSELEEIRALGLRQPIALIPLGIQLDSIRPVEKSPGTRTVLSLGRLHPKKGLDRLLHAWARVSPKHPDWHLTIAGPSEDGYQQELLLLCRKLGCSRLDFVGPLYGSKKAHAYSSAELFVLPSHSENFALTVLEALGHGVPVVASRETPWSALVDNRCGWWVDSEIEPLASALDGAMHMSQAALMEMGERGRAWIEREFTLDVTAARMQSVYEWLYFRSKRPACVYY